MSIDYKFDVFLIVPKSLCEDSNFKGFINNAGLKQDPDCKKVALFNDPKTVAALQACCPRVIKAFKQAGFGCSMLENVPSAKQHPAKDGTARSNIIDKLNDALNAEFSEKERLIKNILHSPINRPATMLDRLSGITPKTDFIVGQFLKSAQRKGAHVSNAMKSKPMAKSWTAQIVSSVLRT